MQKKLVIRPVKPGEPRLTNEEAEAFLGCLQGTKTRIAARSHNRTKSIPPTWKNPTREAAISVPSFENARRKKEFENPFHLDNHSCTCINFTCQGSRGILWMLRH